MINLGKESETIEFKKSTSELNEGIVSIGAILNKHGKGTLYFGVKNDGDAIGQQISDNTLRDISGKIYESIKPAIYPSIHLLDDVPNVIAVDFSGLDKPYSVNGIFYIRVFDEDRKIEVNELVKMINKTDSSNAIWEKLETDETIEDVDVDLLKKYMAKANQCGRIKDKYSDIETTLKKLKLLSNGHLNNAGSMLFSKNGPITMKVAVFATDEKLSFIDINRYEGNILELSELGQTYIKQHINYSAEIIGSERVEVPEIPLEAIREAVLNSLCHSSFDLSINNEIYITPTKVVIFNPGTFPSGYEPKDFAYNGAESVLRNPLISKAMYLFNEIDSWASGFRRIFECCNASKVKVSCTLKQQGFEICFYRNNRQIPTKDEEVILDAIKNNPRITTSELADIVHKSRKTIQRSIDKLRTQNKIERFGSNKTGYWIIK